MWEMLCFNAAHGADHGAWLAGPRACHSAGLHSVLSVHDVAVPAADQVPVVHAGGDAPHRSALHRVRALDCMGLRARWRVVRCRQPGAHEVGVRHCAVACGAVRHRGRHAEPHTGRGEEHHPCNSVHKCYRGSRLRAGGAEDGDDVRHRNEQLHDVRARCVCGCAHMHCS